MVISTHAVSRSSMIVTTGGSTRDMDTSSREAP